MGLSREQQIATLNLLGWEPVLMMVNNPRIGMRRDIWFVYVDGDEQSATRARWTVKQDDAVPEDWGAYYDWQIARLCSYAMEVGA